MLTLPGDADWQLGAAARMMATSVGEGAAIVLFGDDNVPASFTAHRHRRRQPFAQLALRHLAHDRQLPLREVAHGRRALLIDDFRQTPVGSATERQAASRAGFRSAVFGPIGAARPGLVTVWSSRPGQYGPKHLGFLAEFGEFVGHIVDPAFSARAADHALLATIRHDLGNPIAAIKMNLATLLTGTRGEPRRGDRQQLQNAYDAATRALELVAELDTELTRRATTEEATTTVASVVTETMEAFSRAAADKQVRLLVNLFDGGMRVAAPSRVLYRILTNLVGNAVKYCRSGDSVSVITDVSNGQAAVMVTDNGPGIDVDDPAKLFDHAWLSESGLVQGSGLGLSICKRLVSEYDGRISASTAVGRGTSFYLRLPCVDAARPKPRRSR